MVDESSLTLLEHFFRTPPITMLSLAGASYRALPLHAQLRVLNVRDWEGAGAAELRREARVVESRGLVEDTLAWDEDTSDWDIDEDGAGWEARREIPQSLAVRVLGHRRNAADDLERQYRTAIRTEPTSDDPGTCQLIVSGGSKAVLSQLGHLMQLEGARLGFTHFLSLPLIDEGVASQFVKFREEVLARQFPRVTAGLFSFPQRLHFTLCMLRLHTPQQLADCTAALQAVQPALYDACGTRTLAVKLEGVKVMSDDLKQTRVVYTLPSQTTDVKTRVDQLCDVLFERLVSVGVLTWDDLHHQRALDVAGTRANLTLHATLINAKHGGVEGFDATALVREFEGFEFGTMRMAGIELNAREGRGPSGYYPSVARVNLP